MNRSVVLLLSASLLPGWSAVAAAETAQLGARFEERIELASSQEELEQGETSKSFELFELRDLWIRVRVDRMPRTAFLALTFTSPRGEVFYETRVLFSRGNRATEVNVAGAPHSVTAYPATPLPGGFALDQPIPIGVGAFVRYPQPGTWRIEATLDGHHKPITAEMELSVTP